MQCITVPFAQVQADTAVTFQDKYTQQLHTESMQIQQTMHGKAAEQVQRHIPMSDKDDRPLPNSCCNEPVQQLADCAMQGHRLCLSSNQHHCHSHTIYVLWHLAYTVNLRHKVNGLTLSQCIPK